MDIDTTLKRMAHRYTFQPADAEDLLQEGRIAAWLAGQNPHGDTGTVWKIQSAKWGMLHYMRRERQQNHLSLDALPNLDLLGPLQGTDFAPALVDWMAEHEDKPQRTEAEPLPRLTEPEQTVLDWTCRGLTYEEVARTLGCSRRTVQFRMMNVHRKWKVHTAIEAYNVAMEHGLILPPSRKY